MPIVTAESIFFCVRGTTRMPFVSVYIKIPKELILYNRNITLYMDDMKINGAPLLYTISCHIIYQTT